jgi:hypothetical protein
MYIRWWCGMDSLLVVVVAAVLGSITRIVFGYLGEGAPEGEPFIWRKAAKSLFRGVIGGVVIGLYCVYTKVVTDPIGVFLATFTGAISVDVVIKNIGDALGEKA